MFARHTLHPAFARFAVAPILPDHTQHFVPIVIGHLVSDGNFAPALVFIALISIGGVLSYVFLVGKVERVVVPP